MENTSANGIITRIETKPTQNHQNKHVFQLESTHEDLFQFLSRLFNQN